MNFKKYAEYRIPDRRERLKSSLGLNFTNSPLYGAFEKLLGPGSGEISGVLTPGTRAGRSHTSNFAPERTWPRGFVARE